MIEFIELAGQVFLYYTPENDGWVFRQLREKKHVCVRKVFYFLEADLLPRDLAVEILSEQENRGFWDDEERPLLLRFGEIEGPVVKISARFLGLKHDVLISRTVALEAKLFVAYRDISIFKKIDSLVSEQIVIADDYEGAIPIAEFRRLLQTFPNSTELTRYTEARIARILGEYLGTMSDAQTKLSNYLRKKGIQGKRLTIDDGIDAYEARKYRYIRDEIKEMLDNSDAYLERDWQKKKVQFLLLIFPKYVSVLEEVYIKDFYAWPDKSTPRRIDIMLVDAQGCVDIVEIKRPFDKSVLSNRQYRDNYVPHKEFSGAVMQVEKYLFHLNKAGVVGEQKMIQKYSHVLPKEMKLKIINPKAMVILGRSKDFTESETFDFEIIRRKYANVIDIITYDDLLARLENIIQKFENKTVV